jgi:hypothetical protein
MTTSIKPNQTANNRSDFVQLPLENTNNTSVRDSEKELALTQVSVIEQQFLIQKYLQSPFSISWSKLAVLIR